MFLLKKMNNNQVSCIFSELFRRSSTLRFVYSFIHSFIYSVSFSFISLVHDQKWLLSYSSGCHGRFDAETMEIREYDKICVLLFPNGPSPTTAISELKICIPSI